MSILNKSFSNLSKKFLLKDGTVVICKNLYIRLKFQKDIMSIKKYEKKDTFKIKYNFYNQSTIYSDEDEIVSNMTFYFPSNRLSIIASPSILI